MTIAGFEELDYAMTPLGELILRRREVLSLNRAEVFEVKLDGALLMSSIVNEAEKALVRLAMPLPAGPRCDVLIGGLGLGYTAKAALEVDRIASVTVIEFLERVIRWHLDERVPLGRTLTKDGRCHLVHGDFFAAVGSPGLSSDASSGPNPDMPDSQALAHIATTRFHAILLDIDHSPQSLLHAAHATFYTEAGFKRLVDHIEPGGVFALWSADRPDESLINALSGAFADVGVRDVNFYNPMLDLHDVNYIVVARRAAR
ncbi:MAG: spermidine synthase [Phycisphaerae bacterium]